MADTNIQSYTKDFMAVRISSTGNSTQTGLSSDDSFSKQLDRTSKQSFKTDRKNTQSTSEKSTAKDEMKKNNGISKKMKELEEKAGSETVTDNGVIVAQAVADLKKDIAEQLDISVDELESLMDGMNFQDSDLFDAEKLGMIVLQLNDLQQTQDLLFNQNAAEEFKNVMTLLDTAAKELEQSGIQVSDEGFTDMNTGEILQVKAENQDEAIKVTYDITGTEEQNNGENIEELISESNEDDSGVLTKNDAFDEKINSGDEGLVSKENIQISSETKYNESTNQQNLGDGKNHREQNLKSDGSLITETNVRFNPIEEIQVELTEKVGRSHAESIISQITENIKLNVNSEFTSMEMQLYPEHLGKVGVQVAIKDGLLTAQLTAENETVKKAIEAQIINLKENFNNQGLKVENVEVTIASHSFEDNNMHNQNKQSNKDGSKKNRRFNPSLLEELTDITDEQSENTVMETLGNTVNYTA